jgi:MOSC domain-containing protein YiiM
MTREPAAILEAVLVGQVREHPGGQRGGPFARPWRSAFVKEPVDGPVHIGPLGLEGDEVANTAVHGGLEQSVLAYPGAHYPRWRQELGIDEMGPGGFGENLCVSELDENSVCIGDRLEVGGAVLQVSLPRLPCASIDRRWQRRGLSLQVGRDCRTGWYLRVLREGAVRAGDVLHRTARPLPQWTVARVLQLRLSNERDQLEDAAQLAGCELLAGHWRDHFASRVARGGQ